MVKALWIDNSDGNGPIRNPELTDEEYAAGLEEIRLNNIRTLWQAAHDYEFEQISGSAIGLLTLGILQGKPKCSAVRAWINSIWTLYYTRKPTVTHVLDASLNDFSICGTIPHNVPELMTELAS